MSTNTKIQNATGHVQTTNAGLSVRSLDDLPATEKAAGDPEYLAILGDVSGSMSGPYGSSSKLQGLRDAFKTLWEITDWAACEPEAWTFCDYTQPVQFTMHVMPEIPGTRGGTAYREALRIALANEKRNRIIFASDGAPTDCKYPEEEIAQCQNRAITIDTIFIGNNEESEEAQLLRRMADETGGIFTTCKNASELIQQFQQLETTNRLMIGYDPEDSGGGAIQL